MKIRVRKDKEDKGEFRGLLFPFCCFWRRQQRLGPVPLAF